MAGGIRHEDLQELLGAYSLGALEPMEYNAVQIHLQNCASCKKELEQHLEVLSVMDEVFQESSPDHLWDSISDQIEETPPILELSNLPTPRPKFATPLRIRLLAATSAIAIAAASIMGIELARLDHKINQLGRLTQTSSIEKLAHFALKQPGSKITTLTSANNTYLATCVILPTGQGYIIPKRMSPLPPSQTYQLWTLVKGKEVSLALLGNKPSTVSFRINKGKVLLITTEPSGGVTSTLNKPILSGKISI